MTFRSTYPDMLFFIGLNDEVKTRISPLASSKACCSLRPTTDSGGMLLNIIIVACYSRKQEKHQTPKKSASAQKILSIEHAASMNRHIS
jgi:hypothetical protein